MVIASHFFKTAAVIAIRLVLETAHNARFGRNAAIRGGNFYGEFAVRMQRGGNAR